MFFPEIVHSTRGFLNVKTHHFDNGKPPSATPKKTTKNHLDAKKNSWIREGLNSLWLYPTWMSQEVRKWVVNIYGL